ncbi:FAD-binding domain-containing protein [Aspergillus sclerotiicarbonarius CBS 121057]|uniref:FAD-binding domain-containing protein n=1 Tax=Aspergillus sclerotiicarbonarius (strain CBS 121057 / IBT 28362) TaxID=1448318 RepID=A0A319EQH6_ASPSB|nr:FAD-binding domain-containing protein [Aspergillus sclerotiicarbonarius CBS 121057]
MRWLGAVQSLFFAGQIAHCMVLNGTQIVHELGSILSNGSSIYLPADADWDTETTQRFDTWHAPTYVVSVKPALTTDVQKVVRYATLHNISFLATGGGHGYSGSLGALQNGLELDLGYFNSVTVDAANNLMTVGGAVRFSDVEEPCYAVGKAFPVGACPCVGLAGASLGGGIGFYSGLYGAISDSLVSAEVITGTGALVTASESENSDLLWAIKGAGSSYGVATSLTYRVYDYLNDGYAMNADMLFSASQMSSLFTFAKSWLEKQRKELSITFSLIYVATLQEVIHASVPYALNLYEIGVEDLTAAVQYFNDTVASTAALQGVFLAFTQYAQYGFQQHPQNSSSFPYRDVAIQIDGSAASDDDVPIIDSFEREFRDRLVNISGKDELEVYMQFSHGDEGADAWFSAANVPKLRELKRRYDPLDLFRFYNSVDVD